MKVQLSENGSAKISKAAKRLNKTPDEVVNQLIQFHFMHANAIYEGLKIAAVSMHIVEEGVEA